jgi:HEAT repeat protein
MQARFTAGTGGKAAGWLARAGRLGLLLLPAALLLAACLRLPESARLVLWLGTAFQLLVCLLALVSRQGGRDLAPTAVIMLYVIALSWLVLGTAGVSDPFLHLAQAVLLVIPLGFFSAQCLRDSGALTLRRARQLARRLAARVEWPADVTDCRALPEVKALREALHVDASPALELLGNPRAQVRVAALAALEYRSHWHAGQAQIVLQLAQRAPEPEVRAAAVNALANIDDRLTVEALAELLHDPSPLVRHTTTEALLWNTEARWPWLRHPLRKALGEARCQDDGALRLPGATLTAEAIADLHGWAAEKGIVAMRSALTLGVHYSRALTAGTDPTLAAQLRGHLTDPRTPAMLRLELARLLSQHRELDQAALRKLLDPSTPAPVRLIAAETLLAGGDSPEAVAALHELARLPNREMALATAEVVQRRLGVDLGLSRHGPLPAVETRSAAEVARRLLWWATQQEYVEPDAPPPSPVAPPSPVPAPAPVQHGRSSSRVDLG